MKPKSLLAVIAAGSFTAALAGCDAGVEQESVSQSDETSSYGAEYGDTDTMSEPTAADQTYASDRSLTEPGQDTSDYGQDTSEYGQGNDYGMEGTAGAETMATAELVGKTVLSADGEEIGEVADVVEDENGEGQFAVVNAGEFLGIGEKRVAIDARQLEITGEGEVQSTLTKDLIESMPEYEAGDYEAEEEATE